MSRSPSFNRTSQRSAISSVVARASGRSVNASAISAEERRKNSLVSNESFGALSALLVCTHSSAAWWS